MPMRVRTCRAPSQPNLNPPKKSDLAIADESTADNFSYLGRRLLAFFSLDLVKPGTRKRRGLGEAQEEGGQGEEVDLLKWKHSNPAASRSSKERLSSACRSTTEKPATTVLISG